MFIFKGDVILSVDGQTVDMKTHKELVEIVRGCGDSTRYLQYNHINQKSLLLPFLICHGVGDMRKSYYGSHPSDPIYHPMKMVIANYENVTE